MKTLCLTLTAILLAACTRVAPPPGGAGGASPIVTPPPPIEIQVSDGTTDQVFPPGTAAYTSLTQAIAALVASVSHQARTFYSPERYAAEIAPNPHVRVDYGQTLTLTGKGLSFEASRLVVAVVDGELLLLAQVEGIADWSVYLSGDPDQRGHFTAAVRTATGIDLAGGAR